MVFGWFGDTAMSPFILFGVFFLYLGYTQSFNPVLFYLLLP